MKELLVLDGFWSWVHYEFLKRKGKTTMQSNLDAAITNTAALEATYQADVSNVATIQTNIAAASSPLGPAQAQLSTDATAFNASLDALAAAIDAALALSEAERQALGQRAREAVQRGYTVQAMQDATLDVYEELLRN